MTPPKPTLVNVQDQDLPLLRPSAWRIMGKWAAGLLIAAWSIFLLAWLTLYWVFLPRLGQWKPEIEAQAGKALGLSVRIGQIEVRSSGWVPTLWLSDVALVDAAGRKALTLPSVSAAVSPRSLLSLEPRFEQLLIEDAALEVRRDAQGRLHIAGLTLEGEVAESQADLEAVDWVLSQGEFAIRRAQVRWIDEMRQAPPLTLRDVDLVLRNGLRRHEFRLDATPPQDWGDRLSVRARFQEGLFARQSDWRAWRGEFYAELPYANVAELRRHVDLPFELLRGQGALRMWAEVDEGRPRSATADVLLKDVALRWSPTEDLLAFSQLQGRLLARQDPQAITLALEKVSFTTAQGLVWPANDMKLVLRHSKIAPAPQAAAATAASGALGPSSVAARILDFSDDVQILGGEFSANQLDLDLMSDLAERLPLGAPIRRLLVSLSAQGRIEGMAASWEGALDDPRRYKISGRLTGLRLLSQSGGEGALGRPGLEGASIQLTASETGGRADLEIDRGAVTLPGVFENPRVPVDALSARLNWTIKPGSAASGRLPDIELSLASATLRNADLAGEFSGTWRSGPGHGVGRGGHYPGTLQLTGRIQNAQASALSRYVPMDVSAPVREYLRRAIRAGQFQDMVLSLKGDLADFPFFKRPGAGEFKISTKVRDAVLAYMPGDGAAQPAWPEATRLSGRVLLEGPRLEFQEAQGRIFGVDITRISGGIRLNEPHVPLTLDMQGRGPLQDMLRYVQSTPIDAWLAQVLTTATSAGPASLGLKLDVPLDGKEPVRLRGSVVLSGNELKLSSSLPAMTAAKGRVEFTERSFNISGGGASVLGGESSVEGGIANDGVLRMNVTGQVTAEGLRRAPELAWLRNLSRHVQGQTSYRLQLSTQRGRLQYLLTSPLTGMAIQLPEPFTKAAEASWPLRVQTSLALPAAPSSSGTPSGTSSGTSSGSVIGGGALERDVLEISLARVLQARYGREWSASAEPRVVSGMVVVGSTEPSSASPSMPRAGVEAQVNMPALDLDRWGSLLGTTGTVGADASGLMAVAVSDNAYLPQRWRMRAQEVMIQGRKLSRVQALITRETSGAAAAGPSSWKSTLEADQLAGRVEWQPGSPDRLVARLTRLSIPPSDTAAVEQLLDDTGTQWPALDIVVEDFELRGKRLGRLEIEADLQPSAMAASSSGLPAASSRESPRDWRLHRFSLANSDATLSAKGQWAVASGAATPVHRRTQLDFRLDLKNSGALLERLGFQRALKGGEGKLEGQIAWRGSPMSPHVASMEGKMRLDADNGQFLKADAGAARLLGVLSLQSLPRRLILDFRDVFEEGFPFDSLSGDVTIADGVARTNNLRMRGVQAAVLMEGQADITRETQDLQVLVVPEINAGTASLAYAAINPALGLGTFLAQLFLRRPLMTANTREFHISGSWADPKVERIQRAVPATPAAPPATDTSEPAPKGKTP